MLFRGAVCLLFLLVGRLCVAQVVSVRVINGANGRPLQKLHVSVQLFYEKGEKTPTNYNAELSPKTGANGPHVMRLELETDANGAAHFTISEPAPSRLLAEVQLTYLHWHCRCVTVAATADLVQKGIVEGADPAGSKSSATRVKVSPGEILFFARRVPFYEQLLRYVLGPLERE
jgi:hypothetical protein